MTGQDVDRVVTAFYRVYVTLMLSYIVTLLVMLKGD